MQNRISQYLRTQTPAATTLCHRPTLALSCDQPITVDMERFFEFSFSFAEALMDLEDKYLPQKPIVPMQRELSIVDSALQDDLELDIDARWM